jgi:hypothetical protein
MDNAATKLIWGTEALSWRTLRDGRRDHLDRDRVDDLTGVRVS